MSHPASSSCAPHDFASALRRDPQCSRPSTVKVPTDLVYARSHEWLRAEGENGTVGISDHAQAELTDIVYVELPEIGKGVSAGDQVCVVESVKAASDIYSPVSGTVMAVNDALRNNPSLVNTDPYGEGWIFQLKLAAPAEAGDLLTAEQYGGQIGAG
jgi:glycine cleavage system H protein